MVSTCSLDHGKQGLKNKALAGASAQDEVLAAIIKAREEKEDAMQEDWMIGPGPKITFIPLE
jgi:hypothetical protein